MMRAEKVVIEFSAVVERVAGASGIKTLQTGMSKSGGVEELTQLYTGWLDEKYLGRKAVVKIEISFAAYRHLQVVEPAGDIPK